MFKLLNMVTVCFKCCFPEVSTRSLRYLSTQLRAKEGSVFRVLKTKLYTLF